MRELRTRPGTGASNKGERRVLQILNAAKQILIRDGYSGLTMRAVAGECGLSLSNITYYYRRKSDLLRDLTNRVFDGYAAEFTRIRAASTGDTRKEFESVLRFIFRDLATRETTVFFPELWALANHEDYAVQAVGELYAAERALLEELIARLNPRLPAARVKLLAMHIAASIEGHTMFVGRGKPWRKQHRALENTMVQSALALVLPPAPTRPRKAARR